MRKGPKERSFSSVRPSAAVRTRCWALRPGRRTEGPWSSVISPSYGGCLPERNGRRFRRKSMRCSVRWRRRLPRKKSLSANCCPRGSCTISLPSTASGPSGWIPAGSSSGMTGRKPTGASGERWTPRRTSLSPRALSARTGKAAYRPSGGADPTSAPPSTAPPSGQIPSRSGPTSRAS